MAKARRSQIRRAVQTPCIASALKGYEPVGFRVRDVSMEGLLIETLTPVQPGQEVFVTFQAPGNGRRWMQARTRVARVVKGERCSDTGAAAALHFTDIDAADLAELSGRLLGIPPTIPLRALRIESERRLPLAA